MFLRGPQPVTRATRTPVFDLFFWSLFLMPFWSQMVLPRDPKIAQNREKLCSRGLPESTLQKVTKNYAIWKGQTSEFADTYTLSAVFPVAQGPQKGAQKPPKMEPLGTQNHRKNRKTNTQKTHQKNDAKTIKKGAKKDYPFRAGEVSKITKIRALGSKCAPSLQEGFPGTQNTQKSSKKEPPGPPKSLNIMRI